MDEICNMGAKMSLTGGNTVSHTLIKSIIY